MYHAVSHIMNIYHFKVSKPWAFDNQEYTTPIQLEGKIYNTAFLGNKHFRKAQKWQ